MFCLQLQKMGQDALKLLLKYAYPCIENKLRSRGIGGDLLRKLYRITLGEEKIHREIYVILEKLIPIALREIARIASEKGSSEVTEDIIRYYFLKEHEKVIGEKVPERFKDLCLVKEGVVEKILQKGEERYYEVRFYDGERRIVKTLERDIKVGDKVRVHYHYICEKV